MGPGNQTAAARDDQWVRSPLSVQDVVSGGTHLPSFDVAVRHKDRPAVLQETA